MLLLRNKDQQQNNPLATFATHLCRQRRGHEWTASSSPHGIITVNLTLVQCEFHSGKKKLSMQVSNQLNGIKMPTSGFPEMFGSQSQFPGGWQMPVLHPVPCGRPCDHWLFYITFHK